MWFVISDKRVAQTHKKFTQIHVLSDAYCNNRYARTKAYEHTRTYTLHMYMENTHTYAKNTTN